MKGVEKVTISERGFLQVEVTKGGKGKAVVAALSKAGIKASVWSKVG